MHVKTIIVIGANSGIGFAAALKLAKLGHLILPPFTVD